MGSGTVAQDFIGNYLIRIAKIEIALLQSRNGSNI